MAGNALAIVIIVLLGSGVSSLLSYFIYEQTVVDSFGTVPERIGLVAIAAGWLVAVVSAACFLVWHIVTVP